MRASRQPGRAREAASTSPIAGQIATAGASRSLPSPPRSVAMASTSGQPDGSDAGAEKPPVRTRNTAGVETATPGLASRMPHVGRAGRSGQHLADPAHARGRGRDRQTGTSAPSRRARPACGRRQAAHPKAAAKPAAPPPRPPNRRRCRMPPAVFFVERQGAPAVQRRRRPASARAARSTRLSASPSSARQTAHRPPASGRKRAPAMQRNRRIAGKHRKAVQLDESLRPPAARPRADTD